MKLYNQTPWLYMVLRCKNQVMRNYLLQAYLILFWIDMTLVKMKKVSNLNIRLIKIKSGNDLLIKNKSVVKSVADDVASWYKKGTVGPHIDYCNVCLYDDVVELLEDCGATTIAATAAAAMATVVDTAAAAPAAAPEAAAVEPAAPALPDADADPPADELD